MTTISCPYCKTPLVKIGEDEKTLRHHILCCHLAALCTGNAQPKITQAFERMVEHGR
jgi:hypothetical protein